MRGCFTFAFSSLRILAFFSPRKESIIIKINKKNYLGIFPSRFKFVIVCGSECSVHFNQALVEEDTFVTAKKKSNMMRFVQTSNCDIFHFHPKINSSIFR